MHRTWTLSITSASHMRHLGRSIGLELRKERLRLLALVSGDMGVGKSEFARGVIRAAALADDLRGRAITSPTFVLRHSYRMPRARVLHHIDLYRIQDARELEMLGLGNTMNASPDSFVVEWPQLYTKQSHAATLPSSLCVLHVSIETDRENDAKRIVCIKCHDDISADFAKKAIDLYERKT